VGGCAGSAQWVEEEARIERVHGVHALSLRSGPSEEGYFFLHRLFLPIH
jgi:hypothetical protein